jgi:hypothetical protein
MPSHESGQLSWRCHNISRFLANSHPDCHPTVTDVLKRLLPTRPAAYRVGSGAAHSQPWVLDDDEAFNPQTNRLTWSLDPAALAGSADLGITACALTLDAFGALLGADPSGERLHAHEREQAMSIRVRPLLQA